MKMIWSRVHWPMPPNRSASRSVPVTVATFRIKSDAKKVRKNFKSRVIHVKSSHAYSSHSRARRLIIGRSAGRPRGDRPYDEERSATANRRRDEGVRWCANGEADPSNARFRRGDPPGVAASAGDN